MASIAVTKKYINKNDYQLTCNAGGKQDTPAFIGTFICGRQAISVYPMLSTFEGRYPDPWTLCGGGDRTKNPHCAVRAPGATHPGEVMIGQYLYITHIDFL